MDNRLAQVHNNFMKPELCAHLMELIYQSELRAEQQTNLLLRETYARHAKLLRQTLAHYEEVGEDPKLEEAIRQLRMEEPKTPEQH
jgi:hypothetical protein